MKSPNHYFPEKDYLPVSDFWEDFEKIFMILLTCQMDQKERIRACRALALKMHDIRRKK